MAYQANMHAAGKPDVPLHENQENIHVNPKVVDVHSGNPTGNHAGAGWISSMFLNVEAERSLMDTYCFAVIGGAAVIYILLHFLPSAYGRYASRAFGILIPAQVAWFLQDIPAVVIPILVFLRMEHTQLHLSNYILLGLFIASYLQRSVVYPLLIKGAKPVPSVPFLIGLGYNCLNGYFQARYLTRFAYYGPLWMISLNFIGGLLMFCLGLAINLQSDAILRNLRSPLAPGSLMAGVDDKSKTITEVFDRDLGADAAGPGGPMPGGATRRAGTGASRTAGTTQKDHGGYGIPYGGMFQFVSCANFFGEIVEWWGFAMASWSLPALAHAVFTTAVLIPRALQHHQDYLTKFKADYPKNRSAVIPYIL